MKSYDWTKLTPLQIGRYAEYYAKMEFTAYGFEVYTSEVDDHGVDFVIKKKSGKFYEVQVKSIRNMNYVFFHKDKFKPNESLLAILIIFVKNEEPKIYLIPSMVWLSPNMLFVDRDYIDKKSKPEWGINISKKNLPLLDEYQFEKQLSHLQLI